MDLLHSGEVHVAIVAPVPEDPQFDSVVIGDELLYLVVDNRHRLARRRQIDLHELADENFVALTEPHGLRKMVDSLCRQAGFEPNLAFEGQEITTLRGLIRTGLGVGLLPRAFDPVEGIVEIPIDNPEAHREIGAIWLRGRKLPPAAASFVTYLKTSGERVLAESS